MERDKIKAFVEKFMAGEEEDTFIKNEYGNYIYSAGSSSLNLKIYFEEIIEYFLEENNIKL